MEESAVMKSTISKAMKEKVKMGWVVLNEGRAVQDSQSQVVVVLYAQRLRGT